MIQFFNQKRSTEIAEIACLYYENCILKCWIFTLKKNQTDVEMWQTEHNNGKYGKPMATDLTIPSRSSPSIMDVHPQGNEDYILLLKGTPAKLEALLCLTGAAHEVTCEVACC